MLYIIRWDTSYLVQLEFFNATILCMQAFRDRQKVGLSFLFCNVLIAQNSVAC